MSSSVVVRPATYDDLAGIAEVAVATDQQGEGAGADARYVGHLLNNGIVVVAVTAGEVVGYAASIRIGDVDMLADLFVTPASHGSGIGRALLDAVWSDAPDRMTLSSAHPSAIPLYIRYGMTPRFPVFYVRGEAISAPSAVSVQGVSASDAARVEYGLTGVDRAREYAYWAGRPQARSFLVRDNEDVVGVGVLGGTNLSYGVAHLAIAHGMAVDVAKAAVSQFSDPGYVCLAGQNAALPVLLDLSWRIIDIDQFMSTRAGLIDPERLFPHSGLM